MAENSALGSTVFPISRVKRIVKEDKSIQLCSSEAVFLIAKATEHFIKNISAESYELCQLDKRRTVQYKDISRSVEHSEKYFFLADIVPATIPLSSITESDKAQHHEHL
ncbi:hypothetical protein BB561_005026 [Smittium simulii]|uniref:Transcription factor CBF/NF-Y/archaeal histone domain-containing protein n=1 Tax=Smittium simulii TaxID=133385 RepID=A0A2T9YCL9_9FUNG|nr:hypothetical protein BB561_005026 [Smittium simulii]